MKKTGKVLALALGSLMALSVFAACGGSTTGSDGDAVLAGRICYDNLPDDGISISEADTKIAVKNVNTSTAYAALPGAAVGEYVDYEEVATYSDGVFTAVSEGSVYFEADGVWSRIEVTPAYVTDPGNQYSGRSDLDTPKDSSKLIGATHDPSLIEVTEYGEPTYYMFSTGWATGNEVRKSTDLKTWEYVGKTHTVNDYGNSDIFPSEVKAWMNSTNNSGDLQWWAPDIVAAPDGGYWLYTCLVMADDRMPNNVSGNSALTTTAKYSQACIVLYYIADLSQIGKDGATEYVGVLMQSAIPKDGNGTLDVNSIDPQIIYDTDGKMYMAYGSFGTGNWILELDPETGLRKDDAYTDEDGDGRLDFKDWQWIRRQRNSVVTGDEESSGFSTVKFAADTVCGQALANGETFTHDFYGTFISSGNMEAPIIARHDNVKIADETATYDENGEPENVGGGKTYYYSMHSYNGLDVDYQMWGGRSESVFGVYKSVNGGIVYNSDVGHSVNQGNKYMGAFTWSNKTTNEIDVLLTGHNDLFTTQTGLNVAAYITRTYSYSATTMHFLVQVHQYYLNSMGDICINPNRYGGEIDRSVSAEELFAYTDNGKFQMVVMTNSVDWNHTSHASYNTSFEVQLTEDGKIKRGGEEIGSWIMYGKGYIKFEFDSTLKGAYNDYDSGETVYYGVVRPAWLYEQDKSGFTISLMGHSNNTQSMALFLNSQSTMTGDGLAK